MKIDGISVDRTPKEKQRLEERNFEYQYIDFELKFVPAPLENAKINLDKLEDTESSIPNIIINLSLQIEDCNKRFGNDSKVSNEARRKPLSMNVFVNQHFYSVS